MPKQMLAEITDGAMVRTLAYRKQLCCPLVRTVISPYPKNRKRAVSIDTPRPSDYRFRFQRLPIPPLTEPHRIVAEVERRLSVVEELEADIAINLKRADRLRQSILKRAFTGKLVPQDSADEPAEVLLLRIKAEKRFNHNL
ncbi:MAG: hypothetical protein WCJ56_05810 [bacterium]